MEVQEITEMNLIDLVEYLSTTSQGANFHEFAFELEDGMLVKLAIGRGDGADLLDAALEAFFGEAPDG